MVKSVSHCTSSERGNRGGSSVCVTQECVVSYLDILPTWQRTNEDSPAIICHTHAHAHTDTEIMPNQTELLFISFSPQGITTGRTGQLAGMTVYCSR